MPVSADKKKSGKGKQTTAYYLPEPDEMAPRAPMDRPLPRQPQATLHGVRRSVSNVFGIDVSHYQGAINWQLASIDQNVRFVYIKATEGSGLVDSYYRKNLTEARRYGIPAGSYHFFSPSASSLTQLKNFTDNVKLREQDLIPVVDVETRGKGSLADFQGKLRNFLIEIERVYGVKPIIYTGVNFFNKYLAGKFSDYKFNIARYNVEELPPLNENVDVILWQFTQEGRVGGVKGNVDRCRFVNGHGLQDILMPRK